jgi:hypothetical protein
MLPKLKSSKYIPVYRSSLGTFLYTYVYKAKYKRENKYTYKISTNGRMERALSSDNVLTIMNRGYELWLFANILAASSQPVFFYQ